MSTSLLSATCEHARSCQAPEPPCNSPLTHRLRSWPGQQAGHAFIVSAALPASSSATRPTVQPRSATQSARGTPDANRKEAWGRREWLDTTLIFAVPIIICFAADAQSNFGAVSKEAADGLHFVAWVIAVATWSMWLNAFTDYNVLRITVPAAKKRERQKRQRKSSNARSSSSASCNWRPCSTSLAARGSCAARCNP